MVRILLAVLLLSSVSVNAQDRYIVQFKDKNGTTFSLTNPSAYLSAKAIQRRADQAIAIDSTDLPVLARYVDSVRLSGAVIVLNKSKWLNQIAIQTNDATALTAIGNFPFVKSVSQIAFRVSQQNPVINRDKFQKEKDLGIGSIAHTNNRVTSDHYNYGNSYTQIHIHRGEFLHNHGFYGQNMTIAFLDAGFEGYLTNRMFDSARNENRILGTWDFVDNEASVNEDYFHGMSCLSTICANVPGVMVGTAPKAKFYLFRTEDVYSEYPIEEQNWAAGAELADSSGADMITSSLGYYDFDAVQLNHTYADMNGMTTIAARAADLACKKGMVVTNSAGNNGSDPNYKYIITPADGKLVLAVGATDPNGNIAGFSAWGPSVDGRVKPDIASVGSGVYVSATDGNAYPSAGTSYSNPNVHGLIACLWQAFKEMKASDITDAVKRSSNNFSTPDDRYGYGLPDFKKAFVILLKKTLSNSGTTDGNCRAVLNWRMKDDSSFTYEIQRQLPTQTDMVTIATIKVNTPAFQYNNYTFRDTLNGVTGEVNYYLIVKVGSDTTLTPTAFSVDISPCAAGGDIVVSPNPFKDNITVAMNTADAIAKLTIRLVNARGQVVYKYEGAKPTGSFTHNISTGRFSAGVYVLQIANDGNIIYSNKMVCR